MSGHSEERPPLTPAVITHSEEESIAQSLLPWNFDDARARYISLRCSGFTIREALKFIGYAHSSLSHWREDEAFLKVEADIPNLRKELSLEYANIEFIRNYRMVLEKDYRVLHESLFPRTIEVDGKKVPVYMSKDDHDYLLKMRSQYTPQQLQIIETLVTADKHDDSFDFTKFILETRKLETRITVEGKRISVANLPAVIQEEEDNA